MLNYGFKEVVRTPRGYPGNESAAQPERTGNAILVFPALSRPVLTSYRTSPAKASGVIYGAPDRRRECDRFPGPAPVPAIFDIEPSLREINPGQ